MNEMQGEYNPQKYINNKKKIVKSILKKAGDNVLFSQFCNCYLEAINPQAIERESSPSLYKFLEGQFTQFNAFFDSKSLFNIVHQSKSKYKLSVSIMCSDAQYLIFTLENIFRKFNLTITKMYHPLISAYLNKQGKIVMIELPKKDRILFSTCYIEANVSGPDFDLKQFNKELSYRLHAAVNISRDQSQMLKKLARVQHDVVKTPTHIPEFHHEWVELLDWLLNENFSFFGYAEFHIRKTEKRLSISVKEKSQLGILSPEHLNFSKSNLLNVMKSHIKNLIDYRAPFLFDSIGYKCPVKRFDNLMRISLNIPTGDQQWIQYNFIGLLKRSSLHAKNTETPIIKLKIKKIMENKRFWPGSHNYYQTIRLLNNVPKIDLFKTPIENLQENVENLLSITNPNDIMFFTRKRIDKSKLFLMSVIPNVLYSTTNFDKILRYLQENIPNQSIEYYIIPSEQFVRIHFYFEQPNLPDYYPNTDIIKKQVIELVKPWNLLLKAELYKEFSDKKADLLFHKYVSSFPQHHKVRRTATATLLDITYFESIGKTKKPNFSLIPFNFKDSLLTGKAMLLNIYHFEKLDLYHFIPIFRNLNIYFFDELTTRVGSIENMIGYIHAFRIKHVDTNAYTPPFEQFQTRLTTLLKAVFDKRLPNDPLNGLISCSDLEWKDIFILQAYRNYLLQLNPNYTKIKIDKTLLKHRNPTELLIAYFKTKFQPGQQTNTDTLNEAFSKSFNESLNSVSDIDEDYILKWFYNLIENTLRTNYYQHELETSQLLSLKFNGKGVIAPLPKTYREIFVFDPEVEGIHIRFGPVSRGGIRWSSRLNDYRSEVLGLSKTQRVKNVVIVPNGSKGGFVIKKHIDKSKAALESKAQYQKFISALLSITDNVDSHNNINRPKDVICYDNDDPYLVVAADKGTATFSDFANEISSNRSFWLNDAFASGGSSGFNHKDLGITAKGGWECVKLHFLELGKDIQTTPFTCVGIGDMSGDVFGNGMLLSKQTKLIAAFNHLHIFIDPDPDPEISWKERNRLFNLQKSTWLDYKADLISKGGGVYNRSSKHILLSEEAQGMLNLDTRELNGAQLIHAILKCNVELLWFGGIGTYIKSVSESNLTVSDLANDSVRINAPQCKAQVVGEGANLGITQQARIDLCENNVKLNTDFIDNSAGVNISDYEVNLKIFLQRLIHDKHISSMSDRNKILKGSTLNVIESVLQNNIHQHQLLSMEEYRSRVSISPYINMINTYIEAAIINPKTDVIPSQAKFDDLDKKKLPIQRPLLALLQSLVKLDISETLSESKLSDQALFSDLFFNYFPKSLLKKYKSKLNSHPLKKDIIATSLTNYVVNNAGILFFSFVKEITSKSIFEISATYIMLDHLFEYDQLRLDILKRNISFEQKYKLLINIDNNLKFLVIDMLLLPTYSFNEQSYKNVIDTFKQYKTLYKNFSYADLSKIRLFIPFFSINNSLSNQQRTTIFSHLESVYNYFDFDNILSMLNGIDLNSTWEVEQSKLLYKMLSQKKFSIISFCINKIFKGNQINEVPIESLFTEDITSYKKNLNHLKEIESTTLSALTVIINKLNLL